MKPIGTSGLPAAGSVAALATLTLLWFLGAAACKNEPQHDAPRPPTTGAPQSAGAPAGAAPSAPAASGEASSTTGAAHEDVSALLGTWSGRYDAKKGSVVLPKDVKKGSQAKDDGKVAVGAGAVTVTVGPTGEVTGTAKGALGDAKLTGKVEGKMMRASIFPDDPTAANAMTGVLVGELQGETIQGVLRVAGPDATIVRESAIELKKK